MSIRSLIKCISGVVLLALSSMAWSDLLINPTRVQFNPSDRTADITLINVSQVTTTYRLEWSEKQAKSEGGYRDLTAAEAKNYPLASPMLRFTPKQVTLRPNERQTIKMAIRRPQSLADGEYRSHLLFKALPPNKEDNPSDNSATTSIKVVLSFAIPVVIQQGELNYQMDVNNATLAYNPATRQGAVEVNMNRSGVHSVMGNINAYWTPVGGKEVLIAKTGDYNFWPELTGARAALGWVGADFANTDGKLRIEYEGTKNFRGKKFFDKSFTINRSMIKPHQ